MKRNRERDPERWRRVPWNPCFLVSSRGHVRRIVNRNHPERRQFIEIKEFADKDGYLYLSINGIKWRVSRLVYQVWVGPLVPGLVICHKDGSRTNNYYKNFKQTTQLENIHHKKLHGTWQIGDKHPRVKYSEALAARIKRALVGRGNQPSKGTMTDLAQKFDVPYHFVCDIRYGRRSA